jgi:hypothetical protein
MAPAPVREDGECMNHDESVPTTWDDVRDGTFFRIVSHLLDCHTVEAASGLLAANDSEFTTA